MTVKEAVFPWPRFPGIDIVLGPEMKSTGEVMGIDADWGMAYAKSQISAFNTLPVEGNVFIINTPSDAAARAEEIKIRSTAVSAKISHATNLSAAVACVKAIRALKEHDLTVAPSRNTTPRPEDAGDGSPKAEGGRRDKR